MLSTLFINEQQLKDISPISTNVTITSPLKMRILDAQEKYIRPILCKDQYEQLQLEIETNTVTVVNQALLTQIKYCLAYYTVYQLLPYSKIRIREAGPINQTGDNGVNADLEELKYLRQTTFESSQIWEIRLREFIEENKADYPLISNCSCIKCKPDCNSDYTPKMGLFRVV